MSNISNCSVLVTLDKPEGVAVQRKYVLILTYFVRDL